MSRARQNSNQLLESNSLKARKLKMETWKLNEIWYATSQTAKVYPNDTSNPITFGPFFPIVAVVEMSALESFSFLKRGKISLLPFRCKDKETTCHESVCESHLRRQVEALSFITEERHRVVQWWGTSWCKGEMGLLFLYLSKRWSILRRLLYVTLGPLIILEYDVLRRLVGRMAKRSTVRTRRTWKEMKALNQEADSWTMQHWFCVLCPLWFMAIRQAAN